MARREESDDDVELVSIPISHGMVRMQALRDFVEATDDAPENGVIYVLPAELRWEGPR